MAKGTNAQKKKKSKRKPSAAARLQDSSDFFSSDEDNDVHDGGGGDKLKVGATNKKQTGHEDENAKDVFKEHGDGVEQKHDEDVEGPGDQVSSKETDDNGDSLEKRPFYSSDEDDEESEMPSSSSKGSKSDRKSSRKLAKTSSKSKKASMRGGSRESADSSTRDSEARYRKLSSENPEMIETTSKCHVKPNVEKVTSTTTEDVKDAPKQKHTKYTGIQIPLCAVSLLLLIVLMFYTSGIVQRLQVIEEVKKEDKDPRFRLQRFKEHMAQLQKQFPSQNGRLWDVIGGASHSHINNPSNLVNPIIILFAGSQDAATTVSCIATSIAFMFDDILEASQNPIFISGSEYREKGASETKSFIHDQMKTGFKNNSKSAVIHNLDYLPPCSVIIFHNYCDNENAPFKDTAILHTVHLDLNSTYLHDLLPKNLDKVVSDHLRERWSPCEEHMTVDKQDAMLSRVANNIALVMPESKVELVGNCT